MWHPRTCQLQWHVDHILPDRFYGELVWPPLTTSLPRTFSNFMWQTPPYIHAAVGEMTPPWGNLHPELMSRQARATGAMPQWLTTYNPVSLTTYYVLVYVCWSPQACTRNTSYAVIWELHSMCFICLCLASRGSAICRTMCFVLIISQEDMKH